MIDSSPHVFHALLLVPRVFRRSAFVELELVDFSDFDLFSRLLHPDAVAVLQHWHQCRLVLKTLVVVQFAVEG